MSSTTERLVDRRSEHGQVLVLFAGAVLALLIVAALAFDVGMVLVERRDAQNAADAAALAGARYVLTSDCAAPDWLCPEAKAAAVRIALANGFGDDPNESVQVHIPPIHGRYAPPMPGTYIEVEIDTTRGSIFAGVIGRSSWDVGVFAVATNEQNLSFPFSMLALNRTVCKAIQVSGDGLVVAYGNIQSNSNGTDCGSGIGFSRSGGSTINVIADDATCRSAGLIQDQGSGSMTCTPAQNSFALPDPLLGLPAPAKPGLAPAMVHVGGDGPYPLPGDQFPKSCPGDTDAPPSEAAPALCKLAQTGQKWPGEAWILYPGLYPGGLEITSNTTAYLMPGIYWIGGGGIRVATGGTMMSIGAVADATPNPADATWGGGVLIYNSFLPVTGGAGGDINFDGSSANMQLKMLCTAGQKTPPEYGCLPDESNPDAVFNTMSIYQDRTLTNVVILNGSASGATVQGIIYVPGGIVTLNGNGGALTIDQVIADQFNVMGNGGTIRVLRGVGLDALIVAAGLVD